MCRAPDQSQSLARVEELGVREGCFGCVLGQRRVQAESRRHAGTLSGRYSFSNRDNFAFGDMGVLILALATL